jgi:hypothetical protein
VGWLLWNNFQINILIFSGAFNFQIEVHLVFGRRFLASDKNQEQAELRVYIPFMLVDHTIQSIGLGQDGIGTTLIFYFTKSEICVAST